jgi:hypothetical protein
MGAPKLEKFPIQLLGLDSIKVDHAIQSRVATNIEHQREFSEAMLNGDIFPPVTVFFDGTTYWLADGFHRYGAARQASKIDPNLRGIRAEVRAGSRRDAVIFSAGSNIKFSIPRTNEDKRKAVRLLLDDAEWSLRNDPQIARHCGVCSKVVKECRNDFYKDKGVKPPVLTTREKHRMRIYENKYENGKIRSFFTVLGGKTYYLGMTREEAERRYPQVFAEHQAEQARTKARTKKAAAVSREIHDFLNSRNIFCKCAGNAPLNGLGQAYLFDRGIIVTADFSNGDKVTDAVGRIFLNRFKHLDGSGRMVIVCPSAPNQEAVGIARRVGVEFLTPEELVLSIAKNEQES